MYTLRKRRKNYLLSIGIALVVVLLGAGGAVAAYKYWPVAEPVAATASKTKVPPHAVSARSNTLFAGDIFLDRSVNLWSMASPLKYAYPFSRLGELNRSSYNAWIANLECPMVSGVHLTPAQEEATLTFNCDPAYLPELAKWFTAVTLANNHTDNQGAAGVTETRKHLAENGVQYFGAPDPRDLDNTCDVIALPTSVHMSDGTTADGALPVAMCGYHGFLRIPPPESIALMKQYSAYMPVVAMPHAGTEYTPAPGSIITNLYHSMVDNGADMVLGGHPHWVQTSEAYKGHLIAYSMGNFIFDQQWDGDVTRSAAIRVEFNVDGANPTELAKWLALGSECAAYHDDCLAKIKAEGLTKLPYIFKFAVVGTDDSGKITHPASAAIQQSIEQRMRWTDTVNQLQSPYGSL